MEPVQQLSKQLSALLQKDAAARDEALVQQVVSAIVEIWQVRFNQPRKAAGKEAQEEGSKAERTCGGVLVCVWAGAAEETGLGGGVGAVLEWARSRLAAGSVHAPGHSQGTAAREECLAFGG